MTPVRSEQSLDGEPLVRLESDWLVVDVAPGVGGRIVRMVERPGGHEFLWRNTQVPLARLPAGAEYDPAFYGGIDELLPNDAPEIIDGVACPDHGELWTTPLRAEADGAGLTLSGALPRFGLTYERRMWLDEREPRLHFGYRIHNPTGERRHFLWKLHAALGLEPGDRIECPARRGRVVDLAWSRYRTLAPFVWPEIEGRRADLVPPADGTVDFFYLSELTEGRMAWRRPGAGLRFEYRFDLAVFPYAWLFASYGGFNGHYTAILEPCTAMPLSVPEAAAAGQCSVLEPGQSLTTTVTVEARRTAPDAVP